MSSSDTSASVRLTGRVKWFNNKTGFGFITIVGGNDQFKDASEIFAHHSAVKVSQEQYRYLVEGEYVEFSVSDTASGDHKFQAADIRGVKGGKLFCETRNEQRANGQAQTQSHLQSHSHSSGGERAVRDGGLSSSRGRGRGRGRGGSEARGGHGHGGGEWMLVRKDSSEYKGSGRVYSSRPSGQRQPRESSLSESYVEHTQPQSAPTKAPAPAAAPPVPASTPSAEPNEVPATPRAASSRKPKQSKPSS
jgi:CspA family cold shock protein